jgi:TRAP-type mannitol/chloroaromatic compound transport system permease small subunit
LFLPIALLIGIGSIDYAYEAFQSGEQSGDPGGLTNRWIVKSLIPLSFFLLIITAIGFFIRNLNIYKGLHQFNESSLESEINHLKQDIQDHKHNIEEGDKK